MTDRFNPAHIFKSSFSQLKIRNLNADKDRTDRVARAIVIIGPLAALILITGLGVQIRSTGEMLAGVGILSGAFMASFGQLASWRTLLASTDIDSRSLASRRIDEAAAHALAGTATGVILAAFLALHATWNPVTNYDSLFSRAAFFKIHNMGGLEICNRILNGVIVAIAVYLFLLLIMSISLFWTAYEDINDVARDPIEKNIG